MLHTLGHGGGVRGSAGSSGMVLEDGVHHPAEVARPGVGRSILPLGSMNRGWPESTLLGSCFGGGWFPGSELGS